MQHDSGVDDDPDVTADAIVAATLAVRGVVAMSPGLHGEVATYLPGRRVPGVRLRPDGVEVHVVASFGPDLRVLADTVRTRVRDSVPETAGRPLTVFVDDVEVDFDVEVEEQAQ